MIQNTNTETDAEPNLNLNRELMTDGGHVGPIIFSDDTARSQLRDHGDVVTFRKNERTTGETWWRVSRTGKKKGDVRVELLARVDPSEDSALEPYVDSSGFADVDAWRDAIRSLNGELPDSGLLYRATANPNIPITDGGEDIPTCGVNGCESPAVGLFEGIIPPADTTRCPACREHALDVPPVKEFQTDGGEDPADLINRERVHGSEFPAPGNWTVHIVEMDGVSWELNPDTDEDGITIAGTEDATAHLWNDFEPDGRVEHRLEIDGETVLTHATGADGSDEWEPNGLWTRVGLALMNADPSLDADHEVPDASEEPEPEQTVDRSLDEFATDGGTDEKITRWEQNAHTNVSKWGHQSADALVLAMAEELGELADEVLSACERDEDSPVASDGRDLIRKVADLGHEVQDHLEHASERNGKPVPPDERPHYLYPTGNREYHQNMVKDELDDLMALGYQFLWSVETEWSGGQDEVRTDGGEDQDALDEPAEAKADALRDELGPEAAADAVSPEQDSGEPQRVPVTVSEDHRAEILETETCDGADGFECGRELESGEDEINVTMFGPGSSRSGRRVLCGECRKKQDAVQLAEMPDLVAMFRDEELDELRERFPEILADVELETDGDGDD